MATNITPQNHFILVLCGGSGPRLWPLSRASNPKQFLSLFGPESLLQQTLIRAGKTVPKDHVYLITNAKYLPQIKSQTKDLIPTCNIITEPEKKNTLQAISYASAVISQKSPDAVITSLPSDHFITPILKFKKDIKRAAKLAGDTNSLVLIGIRPVSPNPSYGYLQVEKTSRKYLNVSKFIEKPDPKTAAKLILKKALWNSGIYTFTVKTFVQELAKLQPEYYRLFTKLSENLNQPANIAKIYKLAPNLSIDTGISEVTKNIIAIPASFKWNDVGEWKNIYTQLKKDNHDNAVVGENNHYLSINSQNCLIKSSPKKIIGLVGVNNLAVIDTPDGLLVCDLNSSSQVRDLIALMVNDKSTADYFLS